jgi:hypothetical protein
MRFEFAVRSAEGLALCEGIVKELQRLYGLHEDEALRRINEHWRNQEIGSFPDDVVFHEDETFWAKNIFHRGEIPTEELNPRWAGNTRDDNT